MQGLASARKLRNLKRGDLMVEEIKRRIIAGALKPGDRLPKENELLRLFSLSKGTVREALKSLEVQGLVTMKSGPEGGATIAGVPFDRTFQFVENYFFFRDLDIDAIYAMRKLVEPELVAGAVPHLRVSDIRKLEASIECCAPVALNSDLALRQRAEDLHFHDLLAEANPNELLRFTCQLINEKLRRFVTLGARGLEAANNELGRTNLAAHRAILAAIREGDAELARTLMFKHIVEAHAQVKRLQAAYQRSLVLDSELSGVLLGHAPSKETKRPAQRRVAPRSAKRRTSRR